MTRARSVEGVSAEACVEAAVVAAGGTITARRWRGGGGEIDLIATAPDGQVVFIEVKAARSAGTAAARVTPAKQRRLIAAAQAYLADQALAMDIDCRFDVATVDTFGRVAFIENALL